MKNFGARIKELRLEKGLNQSQLAKALYVSQSTIAYLVCSKRDLKLPYIIAIVKYFEISYDEFFADILQEI